MTEPVIVALVALAGSLVGSFATIAGQLTTHWLDQRAKKSEAEPRKKLLTQLLNANREWRRLDTLSHVIGADEETTKKLLIEIGARASEDGQQLWALLTNKPLT